MRLTAGKSEYDLPVDLYKIRNVYVRAAGLYIAVYELPITIPSDVDMSHIVRAESYRRKERPKESIPVSYTIYPPRRGRKKSTILFFPAPSKNWKVDIEYQCLKRF